MASKRVGLLLILTAVVFAFVGIVDSALVVRPTKTCGNQTYVDEVADACTTILAAEVDADIQQLIDAGINNIEEDNLADDAVSTAKIQDDAISTGKIQDDAIVDDKIDNSAVTAPKLADGATFINVVEATGALVTPIGTDTSLISQAITMTRSRIRIHVQVFGTATTVTNAGGTDFTMVLRRGGSPIYTLPTFSVKGNAGDTFTFPISVSFEFIETPGAGTFTYSVTLTETDSGATTTAVTAGIVLEEIA